MAMLPESISKNKGCELKISFNKYIQTLKTYGNNCYTSNYDFFFLKKSLIILKSNPPKTPPYKVLFKGFEVIEHAPEIQPM